MERPVGIRLLEKDNEFLEADMSSDLGAYRAAAEADSLRHFASSATGHHCARRRRSAAF
jgi:hypothetical protein